MLTKFVIIHTLSSDRKRVHANPLASYSDCEYFLLPTNMECRLPVWIGLHRSNLYHSDTVMTSINSTEQSPLEVNIHVCGTKFSSLPCSHQSTTCLYPQLSESKWTILTFN